MSWPRAYTACRSVSPVSRTRVGTPPPVPTRTVSLKATRTSMRSLIPYVPFADCDVTPVTAGAPVSGTPTTMSFEPASEPADPGSGRARSAAVPVFRSAMLPPAAIASDVVLA